MSRKHLDKEDRLEQHYRRVGSHQPRCSICGETDPRCLEKHHIAGRKFHQDTAIVCRNCHRKLSDSQLDHPPRGLDATVNQHIVIAHSLLGLCDLLTLVAPRLREFGHRLIQAASREDAGP